MERSGKILGQVETVIVGGGQAGLSVGRYLKEHDHSFLILEKSSRVGSAWEKRYDSLKLDSFAKYTQLTDFPFVGDLMRQPSKDEVVAYLQSFAKQFDLHPKFNTEVLKIEKDKDNFVVTTKDRVYLARSVVLAIGPFNKPYIPLGRELVPSNIWQIHSNDYKNPEQLKDGAVLVVGGGNSGAEIVEELLAAGKEVYFSFRGKFKSIKNSPLSQWLAYRIGLAHVPKNSWLGKIIIWHTKGKAVGVDVRKLLSHPRLTCVGAFVGTSGGEVICSEQRIKNVANIIWATGYESDFSLISIPGFDPATHKRGVTNIPGLYILNLRWQHSKSSSHLAGISRDAKYIADQIAVKS